MLRIAADLPRRGNTVAVLTAPRYHTSTAEHDLRPVALSEMPIPERPANPHSVPRTGFLTPRSVERMTDIAAQRARFRCAYWAAVRLRVAGPSSSVPSGANRDPCSGLPSLVGVIPVDDAAQVWAYRGDDPLDAVYRASPLQLLWRPADDATVAGRAVTGADHRSEPTFGEIEPDLEVG
jgi:hypothetical protein